MDLCPGSVGWVIELLIDVMFVADIGLNFVTGVDTGNGEIMTDFQSISSNYLKGWFIIDVIAVLPVPYVQLWVANACPIPDDLDGSALRVLKALRLLRLTNLLRVVHLRTLIRHYSLQIYESLEASWKSMKILGMQCVIFYIAHIFACMWFYIGTLHWDEHQMGSDTPVPSGTAAAHGWIVRAGLCGCHPGTTNCTFHPDPYMYAEYSPGTCPPEGCDCVDGVVQKYLTSLYWSVTVLSTVGYGDVTAHTSSEMIFSIIAELCGCMVFASLIGALSTQMMNKGITETKVQTQLAELREYCNQSNLPMHLRKRIRLIMESGYREHAFDEKAMLAKLPQVVSMELKDLLFQSLLTEMPLFKNIPGANKERLQTLLMDDFVTQEVQPGEVVFGEGDLAFEFYVILEGEITLSNKRNTKRVLRKGSFFGERELFFSLRYQKDEHGTDGHLPIHGRLRHQTATVSSKNKATLKFVRW